MSALAPQAGPVPGPQAAPSQASPVLAMLAAAAHGVPHTIQVRPHPDTPTAAAPPSGGSFGSAVKDAIGRLHAVSQMTDDHQDAAIVEKCIAALRGILANEQKEHDQAMGGKLSPRQMRKAY